MKQIYVFYLALRYAVLGYKSEKRLGYPRQEQPDRRIDGRQWN